MIEEDDYSVSEKEAIEKLREKIPKDQEKDLYDDTYRLYLILKGCEDATEHTATELLSCDTEANQLCTDEEIISLVQNKPHLTLIQKKLMSQRMVSFPILKLQMS
ncbi:hypothetical protein AVEN_68705-1 [Araneus ventricosus]|uniref:Uncharacterized protein n=1 Tax=Araneus ventricosus TaxID=182803 RepID=A0A4Y2KYE1_ARAVE|nr:hypothetical protein AVEN_68705-1 [Araneus ventricosus]